jgi:hypothetical protein
MTQTGCATSVLLTAAGRAGRRLYRAPAARRTRETEHLPDRAKEAIQSSHDPGKNEPVASSVRPLCPGSGVRNVVMARSATWCLGVGIASGNSWSAPQRQQAGGGAQNRAKKDQVILIWQNVSEASRKARSS